MGIWLLATTENYSPSVFGPASPTAGVLWSLFLMVLAIMAVIFVVVGGFTIYAVIRFRGRPGDEAARGPAGLREQTAGVGVDHPPPYSSCS